MNFAVWDGTDVSKYQSSPRESFLKGLYDLNENTIKIKIPIESGNEKTLIFDRISNSLNLTVKELNESSIAGEFFIFDVDLNDLIFADMVMNSELVNTYLY